MKRQIVSLHAHVFMACSVYHLTHAAWQWGWAETGQGRQVASSEYENGGRRREGQEVCTRGEEGPMHTKACLAQVTCQQCPLSAHVQRARCPPPSRLLVMPTPPPCHNVSAPCLFTRQAWKGKVFPTCSRCLLRKKHTRRE